MNMKRFGEWMIICTALLALFLLSLGILFTAHSAGADDVVIYEWEEADISRPEKCRHLYEQEGDAWINCMGVGYK